MNRMIEPLKSNPFAQTNTTTEHEKSYTQGFHDGAYALAQEALIVLPEPDDFGKVRIEEVREVLRAYESNDARPCKGWDHEPGACNCNDKGKGQYHLPGCKFHIK